MLSIIVCTRNRAFILNECLESLLDQSVSCMQYNVIVIDNASSDDTKLLVKSFQDSYPNVYYYYWEPIGLSRARNYGEQCAQSNWIGYVDDDARVPKDFIRHALEIIKEESFDCFGGTYYAWFKYGKPKWLPEDFGNKNILRKDRGELKIGEFLSGGIFFIKRSVLNIVGGFNPNLGMTDQIGYGEEDEVQKKLRKANYKIGYDPGLYIEHCVMPHKFKLRWHLKRAYQMGYYSQISLNGNSLFYNLYWLIRTSMIAILRLLIGLCQSLYSDDDEYTWQEIVLKSLCMPLSYFGRIIAILNCRCEDI